MAPKGVTHVLDPWQGPPGGGVGPGRRGVSPSSKSKRLFQDNSWQLYTVQVQTEAVSEGR